MTRISRPISASAFLITGAKSVSVIRALASPWFNMKAMVEASRRVFIAFRTAPVIGTPKVASKDGGTFGAMTETVSPLPIPRAASAEARR